MMNILSIPDRLKEKINFKLMPNKNNPLLLDTMMYNYCYTSSKLTILRPEIMCCVRATSKDLTLDMEQMCIITIFTISKNS